MNFLDLVKKRFSCRNYLNKEVEKEKLSKIMEAARLAPSAKNLQPWYFYVVSEDKDLLKKVHKTYHRDWFNNAPAVILACGDKEKAWTRSDGKNHSDIDVAIAVDHITLAAADLDLSTCWVCNFYIDKVKELFELPENLEPVALIPVAYCAKKPDFKNITKNREKIDKIAKFY